jgi:hypothetical protein
MCHATDCKAAHTETLVCNITVYICCALRTENAGLFDICALLGYYTEYSGNSAPTFRDNLSVPLSSKFKKSNFFLDSGPLKTGSIGCPETSVQVYHSTLRNSPEERRFHLDSGGRLK